MRILLQPSSGKEAMAHYEDTIANGVSVASLQTNLSTTDYSKIKSLGVPNVKVWGIVPTLEGTARNQWVDLKEDDYVLFYANKRFYFAGKVLLKTHNKDLAQQWWGKDDNERTWEYIYFIKEGKEIETPYVPSIIGFKPNHVVMGAILLDDIKSNQLLTYLKQNEGAIIDPSDVSEPTEDDEIAFTKRVPEPRTPDEAINIINTISKDLLSKPAKEQIRTAKIIVRNTKFSRLVKEKARYVCEICGQKPFTQKNGLFYAEAHHKLELAKTKIDNPNEMICVCPMCHKVIHYGTEQALESRKQLKTDK